MKRVYKILVIIPCILFSVIVYSQTEIENNIQSSRDTIINDGQNFSRPQKEVLIQQLEGVNFSYSFSDDNSNCVFHITNSSGNAMKITWDVKLFFSNENNCKEIHKEFTALPQTDIKIDAVNKTKVLDISQSSETKGISNIEIHNVKFKAVQ